MKPNFNPWNTLENLFWMFLTAVLMYFFTIKLLLQEQRLYRKALIEIAKIEKYKIEYDQSNAKFKSRGTAKNDLDFQADLPVLNMFATDSLKLDTTNLNGKKSFWGKLIFWK
jgi:hypothetical protein